MMSKITIYKILPLLLAHAVITTATYSQTLRTFRDIPTDFEDHAIAGGQVDEYEVNLNKNGFLQVYVEQTGLDIVIRLFNAKRELLAEADNPNLGNGMETLSWIGDTSAKYKVEISVYDRKAVGKYRIRRTPSRFGLESDKLRVENERLFREALRICSSENELDRKRLVPLLETASAEWENLHDSYMANLTKNLGAYISVAQDESLNQEDMQVFMSATKDQLRREADLTDIGRRVFAKLRAHRYEIVMTRTP